MYESFSLVSVVASEDVSVVVQFALDFLSDDAVVSAQAQSASWWTWSTWSAGVTLSTWSTLLAVDTVATCLTWLTWSTWGAWSTAIATVAWEAVLAWLTIVTWLAWLTGGAWLTVLAWVTWGAWWTALAGLALWTTLTGWAWLAWLTVLTWVAAGTSWTWLTDLTGWTLLAAGAAVWTLWTLWTLWTSWTWVTWLTLSTVWRDIVAALSVLTWDTWLTCVTWGTVHTGSAWLAWHTWGTVLAWLTWFAWDTASARLTLHLLALALATSNSALVCHSLNGALEGVALGGGFDALVPGLVAGWWVVGTASADSVGGSDVLGQELDVWAAGKASLWSLASLGDGVDVHVDLVVLKETHLFVEGSLNGLVVQVALDNTRVGDDVENSSGLAVKVALAILGTMFQEHLVDSVETDVDVVSLALVLAESVVGNMAANSGGSCDSGLDGLVALVITRPHGDVSEVAEDGGVLLGGWVNLPSVLGVGVDGNLETALAHVVSVFVDDHVGLLGEHLLPEVLDTGGAVQEYNNLNVALYLGVGVDIVATSTLALAPLDLTVPINDLAHLSSGVLLGRCHCN